jgi:AraC-like DNA-binding protein
VSLILARYYPPHPLLSPFVSAYLFTKIEARTDMFTVDLFPVGHSVLSFAMDELPVNFLGKQRVDSDFNLTGQLTQYHHLSVIPGNYSYVYVVFKPYGAWRLFHFPQHELMNDYGAVSDILGKEGQEIHRKLVDHKDNLQAILRLLEEWLLMKWQQRLNTYKMDAVTRACMLIESSKGSLRIGDLGRLTGMSKSTLERHFTEKVGVNPKLYSRIKRFNHVFNSIQQNGFSNWQEVVHSHGFYDQAHFIKDFKTFFNHTPSEMELSLLYSAGLLKGE